MKIVACSPDRWCWRGGGPTTGSGWWDSKVSRPGWWWKRGGTASSRSRTTMLTINVVTLFPEMFAVPLATSILGRAAEQGLVRYRVVPLRDYTHDKHHTVDDAPYGGGAGMALKPEPFLQAAGQLRAGPPIVLLSAPGPRFPQPHARALSFG